MTRSVPVLSRRAVAQVRNGSAGLDGTLLGVARPDRPSIAPRQARQDSHCFDICVGCRAVDIPNRTSRLLRQCFGPDGADAIPPMIAGTRPKKKLTIQLLGVPLSLLPAPSAKHAIRHSRPSTSAICRSLLSWHGISSATCDVPTTLLQTVSHEVFINRFRPNHWNQLDSQVARPHPEPNAKQISGN